MSAIGYDRTSSAGLLNVRCWLESRHRRPAADPTLVCEYHDLGPAFGRGFLVADAHNLPFGDESIDVLFAILADPYNLPKYWEESARVMRPRGLMVFLVPSYVWTCKFRTSDPNEHDAVARFELRNGVELFVPSYILSAPEQIALAREYGFETVDFRTVSKEHLQRIRSPKLCLLEPNDAVVEGYVLRNQ